jgi:polysaccharide export outer membrane protein
MITTLLLWSLLINTSPLAQASGGAPATATAGRDGQAPRAPSAEPTVYTVGPEDVLKITVFGEPDLTGSYKVDADGSIPFPLLQRVEVNRLTSRQIEALIKSKLEDGYVNRAQVTVEVEHYKSRSIFILGEVREPGKYILPGELTLLEVLALAGSVTAAASGELIVYRALDSSAAESPLPPADGRVKEIFRASMKDLETGRASSHLLLQHGDRVFVPKTETFYVTGFVRQAGEYPLRPAMTVEQALAVAGGVTERGSRRGIKILRTGTDGQVKEVDAKLTDRVQPGDTIKVRQRFI